MEAAIRDAERWMCSRLLTQAVGLDRAAASGEPHDQQAYPWMLVSGFLRSWATDARKPSRKPGLALGLLGLGDLDSLSIVGLKLEGD